LLSLWKTGEQQLADIQKIKEQFLNPHSGFHTISLDEALAKHKRGKIILIDVRPSEEYEYDHIPGAISIPLGELVEHLNELSNDLAMKEVSQCNSTNHLSYEKEKE
jgi:rhodanese-related sulfurtransferase